MSPVSSAVAHLSRRRPTRILIFMSDTGGGHRSVAQALKGAFHTLYGSSVETYIVDLFALGRLTAFDRVTRLYGPLIRHSPWLWGALYRATDYPKVYWSLARTLEPLQIPKVQRLLEAVGPHAVVSVHPLCTRLAAQAIQRLRRPIPLVAVPTDLVSIHASHVTAGVDLFVAPTGDSRRNLMARNVPPEKIVALGLPVDERFGRVRRSPSELRKDRGLAPDKFTALLMAGGEGAGPLPRVVQAVDQARLDLQLLVVCGRNKVCRGHLENKDWSVPRRIFGFVQDIPEMMAASDVVVTKAGPQTIAEALASGRPLLLTHALPGQEEDNVRYVEEGGAGYFADAPDRIAELLRALSEQPSSLMRLRESARALGRPQAAREVARAVMDLVPVPEVQLEARGAWQRWGWGRA